MELIIAQASLLRKWERGRILHLFCTPPAHGPKEAGKGGIFANLFHSVKDISQKLKEKH